MRILIDVCLSPQWVEDLQREGVDAVHWTSVGNPRAKDREIIEWARTQGCIVFTHDLARSSPSLALPAQVSFLFVPRTCFLLPSELSYSKSWRRTGMHWRKEPS